MGASDTARKGYPKSLQKRDFSVYYFCGGGGAGACPVTQGKTQVRYGVELDPFIVSNDSLLLRNPEFGGIALYTDLGPDAFCSKSYNINDPEDWYLGFSNDGVLTDAEVIAQGNRQSGLVIPYDIEIAGTKLPQPTDSDWSGTLYIHIAWTNANFISDEIYIDDVQYLKIVKHNYQTRQ